MHEQVSQGEGCAAYLKTGCGAPPAWGEGENSGSLAGSEEFSPQESAR